MDSATIQDIFTCGICLETFDESAKYPRMLNCGHSFCHSCLGKLLAQDPYCPNCRTRILYKCNMSIPINISLKSLINIRSQILMPNTPVVEVAGHLHTRHVPQTLQELGALCQNSDVYAVENRFDGVRFGKMALKEGRILVNSFQLEKPECLNTLFNFPELLSRFNNGSIELPKTVFLRVAPMGGREDSFEMIIETEGLTPRARNFIFFSSGLKGPCYKGMTMYGNEWFYYIKPGFHNIVDGISNDDPRTPWKEGGVYGMSEFSSAFEFKLDDNSYFSGFQFGVVVAGLSRMKDLDFGKRECTIIKECGLVI